MKTVLIATFVLIFITGCNATVKGIQNSLEQAAHRINNANQPEQSGEDAGSLKRVGLYDIFLNKPFDTSKKSEHQWPRVAIEVLSTPPNVNDFRASFEGLPDGCFELKAKIWNSKDDVRETEVFEFCFATDTAWNVALRDYENWASRWAFDNVYREHGGADRSGSLPPETFAPSNIKYKRAFPKAFASGNAYSADSVLGKMFFSIAAHAAIDPSVTPDHRLWFTRIAPLD